jgi:hypothetical protein
MTKRASLSAFAPAAPQEAPETGPVLEATPETPPAPTPSRGPQKGRRPVSVTVYLDSKEIRTLKLIGIDHNRRVTDICAEAIREWLQANGHARKR